MAGITLCTLRRDFVTRISLSDGKYTIVKPPRGFEAMPKDCDLQLGKSKDGVCAFGFGFLMNHAVKSIGS
uniref:Uncharacterized protein n=1 Tax=Leersia perrieri TaxID=77586 RepID=A0A0D9WZ55_9ORYZ